MQYPDVQNGNLLQPEGFQIMPTYRSTAAIEKQIEDLKREAEAIRQKELKAILDFIRQAVQTYGIRASDIYPTARAGDLQLGSKKAAKKSKAKNKLKSLVRRDRSRPGAGKPGQPRYSDGTHTWSGFGRKPGWFVQHLAAGRSAEELRV